MTPAELQAWAHGCAHRLLCMWERAGGCGGGKDCQAFPTEIQAAAAALVSAYQEGHAAGVAEERARADTPCCRCHLDDPYCPVHVAKETP